MIETNENLQERFGRSRAAFREAPTVQNTSSSDVPLNQDIRTYAKRQANSLPDLPWTSQPEFPSTQEVFDANRQAHDEEPVEVPSNIIVGPFESKENYLSCQYELLREDAISPLRDVISELQVDPFRMERNYENGACIYEKAYIRGFVFANSGLAARKLSI